MQDQRVSYELQQDNRGKMSAVNLKAADDAAPAPAGADDQAEPATDEQAD